MANRYRNRQNEMRVSMNADQSEFEAILRGSTVFEAGIYDDRVSGAIDDIDVAEPEFAPDWQRRDLRIETVSGEILNELLERQALMGANYPFVVDQAKGSLEYNPSGSGFYEYCLAISCSLDLTTGAYTELPRSFERLTAVLVREYLGADADYLHVGAPRDATIGTTLEHSATALHNKTQEWFWNPRPEFVPGTGGSGDEGMDFVAWKNTPDGRTGKLFVIGQCACGNDWADKFEDLQLSRLRNWMRTPSVEPVRAFAIPHFLSETNLINATSRAGLVFDRARLTALAAQSIHDPTYLAFRPTIDRVKELVIN